MRSLERCGGGEEERVECDSRKDTILASASLSSNQTVPSSAGLAAWLFSSSA